MAYVALLLRESWPRCDARDARRLQQHGAEIDVFANPRSYVQKWPGCLFRLTFPDQSSVTEDAA